MYRLIIPKWEFMSINPGSRPLNLRPRSRLRLIAIHLRSCRLTRILKTVEWSLSRRG